MTGKIFINYRRGDDPGNTGRLFDRLQEAFEPDQLFMDVDSIKPGLDFVKVLEEQVSQCDIVLAVIGHGWISARDEAGVRRLDNPSDFVRIEIESALAQGKRVIPVLVGEARLPRLDELPDSIKPLARRHAVRLTHERFRADVQGLVKALLEALQEADAVRRAQAEAARHAAAEQQRKRAQQAARELALGQRSAEKLVHVEKKHARLSAAGAALTQTDEAALRPQRDGSPHFASLSAPRRAMLVGGALAAGIMGMVAVWFGLHTMPTPLRPKISPGLLTVGGPGVLLFGGREGGPFTPSRFPVALKAEGSGIHWSVDGTIPPWLSVSPNAGDLAANTSGEVTVTLTPEAQSLGHGRYDASLNFKNKSTNDVVSRAINLMVQEAPSPGYLTVGGPDVFTFTGPEGGPFNSGRSSLSIEATGSDVHWSVVDTIPPWLNVSPRQGDLKANAAAEITFAMTATAESLLHGRYDALITFKNHSGNTLVSRGVNLIVQETAEVPLSLARERVLKRKDNFSECANCPEMVVVPAGQFAMGSKRSWMYESPQHTVTLARPFAVGRFAITFEEWDACVADSGCNNYKPADQGWGRGRRPVINVSWDDANSYAAWLSRKTGRVYRLLSEAEYEYAARAGTTTTFPWGNEIGNGNAVCEGCGSQWDKKQTAPVGSFAPNAFGLYDMVGNVWQWVEDCYHDNFDGAPKDGVAWAPGSCDFHVLRGAAWYTSPESARRGLAGRSNRSSGIGFRVGRTLAP